MTALTYLDKNVYEAALDRVRFIYDRCDDVIVAMSGGKDSTVLLHLARTIAAERNRFPIKVFWLDMEAEWDATTDYMTEVMTSPNVEPYWFQIPFRLINALSGRSNFLLCWDPAEQDKWVQPYHPISIKVNPLPKGSPDRFDYLINNLPSCCNVTDKKYVAILGGMRMAESIGRRLRLITGPGAWEGIKWCNTHMVKNTRVFWPIYDFEDRDVWTCIAKNNLSYNRIYDLFYRYGVAGRNMRVCSMIHETAWHDIRQFQEIEPETFDRCLRRVPGMCTFNHLIDDIVPHTLPPHFNTWQEYRDYLLEHLIAPENRSRYQSRWKNQKEEIWYKQHVNEIACNDIDGTRNDNFRRSKMMKFRESAGRTNKDEPF